eukprot:scaffold306_cov241-Pinguiococcus_pyrenoidosus.AAC.9
MAAAVEALQSAKHVAVLSQSAVQSAADALQPRLRVRHGAADRVELRLHAAPAHAGLVHSLTQMAAHLDVRTPAENREFQRRSIDLSPPVTDGAQERGSGCGPPLPGLVGLSIPWRPNQERRPEGD